MTSTLRARRLRVGAILGGLVTLGSLVACALDANDEEPAPQIAAAELYTDSANAVQNDPANAQYDVLTQHNDNARAGAALHEDVLTPAALKAGTFGPLGAVRVTGKIYAQPLYVEKAAVRCGTPPGPVHNANIVYVATLENIVYAIDVDATGGPKVCWYTSPLGTPEPVIQPGKADLLGFDTHHEGGVNVGIVSTPVIDLAKSVLYAVTRELIGGKTHFFVNAIDTRVGAALGRAEITSDGVNGCNGRPFIPDNHNNRPGLLLVGNKLFAAFGGTRGEDAKVNYHGYVIGFDVTNPAHPAPMPRVYCSTPLAPGGGAGIWMAGGGLASDGASIYFTTGNGGYALDDAGDIADAEAQIPNVPLEAGAGSPLRDLPDSFVKLDVATLALQAGSTDTRMRADFPQTTPYIIDENRLTAAHHSMFWARERSDADLGSAGILLLGNRVVGGGKDGRLYALDTRDLNAATGQSFQAFVDTDTDEGLDPSYGHTYVYRTQWYSGPNIHGGPIAWDVRARGGTPSIYVYAWSEKDVLKRFLYRPDLGVFQDGADVTPSNPAPMARGSVQSANKSMPGGMLSLSANGATGGIVWAVVEEPFPNNDVSSGRCYGGTTCRGCALTNDAGVEYCDAFEGYVQGRLYAFAADDNGAGALPVLWGDRRRATPNNVIPRYAKFTPPTVAHGKIVLATADGQVLFYGLNACTGDAGKTGCVAPEAKRADDLMAPWNGGGAMFGYYAAASTGFAPHTQAIATPDGGWDDTAQWLSGDVDGDGLTDVISIWNDGGTATLTVRRGMVGGHLAAGWHWRSPTSPGFNAQDEAWRDPTRDVKWLAGDFDGDMLTDVVRIWNDGGSLSFTVYRSQGTRFEKPVLWTRESGGWWDLVHVKWMTGDFDGDGLTDIGAAWANGSTVALTVRRSTRASFQQLPAWSTTGGWMDSTKWLAGDFDGDGRCDVAGAWNNGNQVDIAVYPSTGTAFAYPSQWAENDGGWMDYTRFVVGDYDGDGRADIARIWNENNQNMITVSRSTGTSHFATTHWAREDGGWMDSTAWLPGKFH